MKNGTSQAFGKWILSGEHTVLRGGASLAFPLRGRTMNAQFDPIEGLGPELFVRGESAVEIEFLFWSVLEKACQKQGLRRDQVRYRIEIYNQIPLGTGLGSSAALCVTVARLIALIDPQLEALEKQEALAHELEHLFHGESSGLDVAVSIRGRPLKFFRHRPPTPLGHLPESPLAMTLSWSGSRGATKECVEQVQKLIVADPLRGQKIDSQMQESVRLCEEGLFDILIPLNIRHEKLIQGIDLGRDCFEQWGLVNESLNRHMIHLKDRGALACKPTGSGRGGYVLAIWPKGFDFVSKGTTDDLQCF